jgi:hypothetical protein
VVKQALFVIVRLGHRTRVDLKLSQIRNKGLTDLLRVKHLFIKDVKGVSLLNLKRELLPLRTCKHSSQMMSLKG